MNWLWMSRWKDELKEEWINYGRVDERINEKKDELIMDE